MNFQAVRWRMILMKEGVLANKAKNPANQNQKHQYSTTLVVT